jgi:hypothetical protein
MGKGKPVRIGTTEFPTKKAAREALQKILYAYRPGQRVTEEHGLFLADVLFLHPEFEDKAGCGVTHFTVEQNEGSVGFWLHRPDGTKTDWSFYSCLDPPTAEDDALKGFRSAVRSQIEDFKTEINYAAPCPITNRPLLEDDVHIDHQVPFRKLVEDFLATRGLALRDVTVVPTIDGQTTTVLADAALRDAWRTYHQTHAVLRAVSAEANLGLLRRKR